LAQEALVVDAEVDGTYVSRLERGLENPIVAVLQRLAEALGASTVEFFEVPSREAMRPAPLPRG
jgi:transcriptional regulator with XRE-family HTH domain